MISIRIFDRKWKITMVSGEQFEKDYGTEFAGVTADDDLEIVFHKDEFDQRVVVHELIHAYYSSLCTKPANLTAEQTEEVLAEMISFYYPNIIRHAKQIVEGLGHKAET